MRLIDADALTDRIEADKKQDNISPGNFFLFKAYIMNAPTIEPDGDTISRQAAINEIKNVFDDVLCCNVSVRKGLPEAIRRIEKLPSAEERKEDYGE